MRLSLVEALELKALVEAEMDRRFEAIKDKLDHYWTVVVGYDAEQAWSEVRELVADLVESNLAALDKGLAIVIRVPPANLPEAKAPEVEVLEPEPVEPGKEPGKEPEAEPVKPEPEPGKLAAEASSRRSRT